MGQADPGARPTALIVAGPTCSGKSALAMVLAGRLGGVVINADSMQVYRELRVLTARPTPADEARVPHALYGVRPAAEPGSAGWWRGAALAELERTRAIGRVPILCGGTGLYLAALVQGITDIPLPSEAARDEARALLEELGAPGLHARLAAVDRQTAAGLRPSDGQRLARAWEVWRSTGQGLAAWHARPGEPPPWRFRTVLLDPPREALRTAIAGRFDAMLHAGALDEVRGLLAQGLNPALPAMRAHGVPELSAYLQGAITLSEAAQRATLATGQYTKRQATWFHNQTITRCTHTIHARFAGLEQFSESSDRASMQFIHGDG